MRKRHAGERKYAKIFMKPLLAGNAIESKEEKKRRTGPRRPQYVVDPQDIEGREQWGFRFGLT
jgi:hypothetical protein